jgi:hypothetical protein
MERQKALETSWQSHRFITLVPQQQQQHNNNKTTTTKPTRYDTTLHYVLTMDRQRSLETSGQSRRFITLVCLPSSTSVTSANSMLQCFINLK